VADDEAETVNLVSTVRSLTLLPLGEHVTSLARTGRPVDRSLVHWLRRLIFRSAWLDQRVKEGELDVIFDEDSGAFVYIQPDRVANLSSSRLSPVGVASLTCDAEQVRSGVIPACLRRPTQAINKARISR